MTKFSDAICLRSTPRTVVAVLWLIFLARSSFYCFELPIWEGFDEWAHFSVIQHIVENGSYPARTDPVSEEVAKSLELLPNPFFRPEHAEQTFHYDQFWKLPPAGRMNRLASIRSLSPELRRGAAADKSLLQYEAQQAPLYYVIMSAPYLLIRNASLPGRVLILRLLTVFFTSLVVPVTYLAALKLFRRHEVAACSSAVLVASPGFMIDICRVSNEGFAVLACSILLLVLLEMLEPRRGSHRDWLVVGLFFGVGLLTKAYVLAFLPLLLFVALLKGFNNERFGRRSWSGVLLAVSIAAAIAGWWYFANWQLTGAISGEQIDASVSSFSLWRKLQALTRIQWLTVLDVEAYSHIWMGGWSFLVVRRWMYRVFEIIAALVATGILLHLFRLARRALRKGRLDVSGARSTVPIAMYLLFCAAMIYQVLVVYLSTGHSAGLGWYLYAVVLPEILLIGIGCESLLQRRFATGGLFFVGALAALFDIYTMNLVLIPFHLGLTPTRPGGSPGAFHIGDFGRIGLNEILSRATDLHGSSYGADLFLALWIMYLGSTLLAVWVSGLFAFRANRIEQFDGM